MPSYMSGASVPTKTAIAQCEDTKVASASRDVTTNPTEVKKPLYTIYENSAQIVYRPEDSLKEGTAMVKTLKNSIREKLKLSKLREEVWLREVERFVYCMIILLYHLTARNEVCRIKVLLLR